MATVTVKPTGGDYTSLANAEAGEDGTLAEPLTIECYAMQDAGQVYWDGWITTTTNRVTVTVPVAERFTEGKWSDTAYRLVGDNANGVMYFNQTTDYLWIDFYGIQIKQTSSGLNCHGVGGANLSRVRLGFYESIIACGTTSASNAATRSGINFGRQSSTPARTVTLRNVLVDGFPAWGLTIGGRNHTIIAYNVTIVDDPENGGSGFFSDWTNSATLTLRAKNVLVQASGTNFSTTATTTDYADNLSSDATALGADAHHNATVSFEDAANHDYRLSSSDTAARDQGTSLAADAYLPFGIDIAGTDRTTGTWDIGCYEFAGGPPVPAIISADDTAVGEITVSQVAEPTGGTVTRKLYRASAASEFASETAPGAGAVLIANGWNGTAVVETGVGNGVTRYYAEYDTNANGTSRSNVVSATTLAAPGVPVITGEAVSDSEIEITLTTPGAGATSHEVWIANDDNGQPGTWTLLGTWNADGTTWTPA
jgi:hypothetical protein